MSLLQMGACTVSNPTPERRQARADRTDAPAIPREPAINSACPKLPLWANFFRGLMRERISSTSNIS